MSDFLSRLLDRAMERAPLLERRKPSIFEPAHFSTEGIYEEPPIVEREAFRPSAASQNAVTSAPSVGRVEPLEDSTRPPERHESIAAESARPGGQAVTQAIPPVAQGGVTQRIVERREMQTKEIETVVERSETRAIETREIIREPHIEHSTTRVEKAEGRALAVAPLRSDLTIATPKTASTVIAREIATPRVPSAGKAAVSPKTRKSARERSLQPIPSTEVPAPTVTVTIGRVDVRAGEPARPASRSGKAFAPQLSLDDYLSSRGRGGQ